MGTIPSQNIEQIAAANDIVEVISSYFPLKRAGSTFKALCPFHQEKTPSFTVSPQRQTFHCFGCGAGGSVFRFVMDYEHLDFPAAVRKLAARAGVPVIEERGASGEDDRQHETRRTLLQLHAEAAEWFHENLVKSKIGAPAREYLKKRGIDRRIANDWQIGFAPDSWDAFLNLALERGYRRAQILQSGLIKPRDENRPDGDAYDRFRGRIMFPIHNDVGEVIAFSGRVLEKESEGAKYLNSPETPLFRKGHVLFGLHKTKRGLIEADCAIVCEGQLDLITVFEAGITNVVAPQGTAFTENQARILKRFVSEVVLCFDADAAGQKAAERSVDALLQNNLAVRIVEMPAGEDPDSIIRTKGKEDFEERIRAAREFFDYWVERETRNSNIHSDSDRVRVARRLAETIVRIPDSLLRGKTIDKVASQLGLSSAELTKLLPAISTRDVDRPLASGVSIKVPQVIEQLCRLALCDVEFRNFLLTQDWRRILAKYESGSALGFILEAQFDVTERDSIEAFLNSVDEGERPFYSHLLTEKRPEEKIPGRKSWKRPEIDTMRLGKQWWTGLQMDGLRRELKRIETLMAQPNLSTGEVVNLQKQILDLTEQLRELSQFSSARVLDT
jgi:DNA primase